MALAIACQPNDGRVPRRRHVPGALEIRQRIHGPEDSRESLGGQEAGISSTHSQNLGRSADVFQRGGFAHTANADQPSADRYRPALHPFGTTRGGLALLTTRLREEPIMDREHIKGAADKVKGAVKDTAGKVTGDEKMQAEGKMDKAKGAAHNAVGDAKDTVRDATR